MNQKISLYIPCYNAERYIAGTIEGALRRPYPLDEVLVVDDGSRDRTGDRVALSPSDLAS